MEQPWAPAACVCVSAPRSLCPSARARHSITNGPPATRESPPPGAQGLETQGQVDLCFSQRRGGSGLAPGSLW